MTVSEDPSMGPRITIAIPTYNRAAWLHGCVASALSQTYPNFEVLVSDNASTDETPDVLKSFDDPRLRVVRQASNIGLMPNWNACIAEARGDYIVFVPDDDRISPWMLARCVDLLTQDPQLVMVVALNDLHLTEENRTLPPARSRTLATGIHDGSAILLEYLKGELSVQLCTLMMRTDLLRKDGGFASDWPYGGDTAAWGCTLMTGRAGLVNESCGTFAWHDESASSRYSIDDRLDSGRKFVAAIDEAADRHVADPKLRAQIKRQARRYVGGDIVGALASYRKNRAPLIKVLPLIWQSRREIWDSAASLSDLRSLARPLAIILLPAFVSRFVSRVKQCMRNSAASSSGSYRSTNA